MSHSGFVASHTPASWEAYASLPLYAQTGAAGEATGAAPATSSAAGPREVLGVPTLSPDQARRLRSALPAPVRLKLEALELDAAGAHAVARLATDRAMAARDELRRLTDRLAEFRAVPWFPQPESTADLEATIAAATADVARLDTARDEAIGRWQSLARLAERCAAYLGVPAR